MPYYILVESATPGSFYIPEKIIGKIDNSTPTIVEPRYFEIYCINLNSKISDLTINSPNIIVQATDQASALRIFNTLLKERIYKRLEYYEKELPVKM